MRGYHDVGGLPAGPLPQCDHDPLPWEKRVHALLLDEQYWAARLDYEPIAGSPEEGACASLQKRNVKWRARAI